jgi:N6-adenosine-specific RNA methylase IME4
VELISYGDLSLRELEDIVEKGLATFVDVGMALLTIRDKRLYKEQGYSNFESYLDEKWGLGRRYAYYQMTAGYITSELMRTNVHTLPKHEGQVRPLARLGSLTKPTRNLWVEAWTTACEVAEGEAPTAREVAYVVREMIWRDKPATPDEPFRVVYADFPWEAEDEGGFSMEPEELSAMTVTTDREAALFAWAPNTMLAKALEVIGAWGFEYRTNFVWVMDESRRPDLFLQNKHELLLLATKGGILPEVRPTSVILKKNNVYETIESMYDGPYLELFAPKEREGWLAWKI